MLEQDLPPIESLVPHAAPMLWLDEVLACDERHVECGLRIRDEHVFVRDGSVHAVIGLEWMAQAVAVWLGVQERERGLPPRPGFLVGVPLAELHVDGFRVGDCIRVVGERLFGDTQVVAFEARLLVGETLAATAKLNCYRPQAGSELSTFDG